MKLECPRDLCLVITQYGILPFMTVLNNDRALYGEWSINILAFDRAQNQVNMATSNDSLAYWKIIYVELEKTFAAILDLTAQPDPLPEKVGHGGSSQGRPRCIATASSRMFIMQKCDYVSGLASVKSKLRLICLFYARFYEACISW